MASANNKASWAVRQLDEYGHMIRLKLAAWDHWYVKGGVLAEGPTYTVTAVGGVRSIALVTKKMVVV